MTREKVQEEKRKEKEKTLQRIKFLISSIEKTKFISKEDKEKYLKVLTGKDDREYYRLSMDFRYEDQLKEANFKLYMKMQEAFYCLAHDRIPDNFFVRLIDSEPVFFDSDIIVTAPFCICLDKSLNEIGIRHSMSRDTIYGDWSCMVLNQKKECLGTFFTDSGTVCVCSLPEVLSYNQNFNYNWDGGVITIRDFQGEVQFVVKERYHENDSFYEVSIVGNGKNKITGKPIRFHSVQTNF